ncbi:glutathione transferase gst 23, partial [Quercus suber]
EEQEKATKEACRQLLKITEDHGLGEKKFFGGNKIGLADLAFGWLSAWLEVMEEVVGVKLMEANSFPRLEAWTKSFKEDPMIKENLPDRDEITGGQEQVKATEEVKELLGILEEHGLGEKKFFGGSDIGLADLAFGWIACLMEILQEAAGVKVLEADSFPRLKAWIKNFNEIPAIKESLRDRNELLTYFKWRREQFVSSAAS